MPEVTASHAWHRAREKMAPEGTGMAAFYLLTVAVVVTYGLMAWAAWRQGNEIQELKRRLAKLDRPKEEPGEPPS